MNKIIVVICLVGVSFMGFFIAGFDYGLISEPDIWDKNNSGIGHWTGTAEGITENEIHGFAISDDKGNVKQYPITELDKMPCDDFMPSFHPGMVQSEQRALIGEKMASCLEKGGYVSTHENMGGGAIDMNPDLSPSYHYSFAHGLIYGTIIPLAFWFVGISAVFLIPNFILKRKNIPTRPYLVLSLAGILLFFGIPNSVESLRIFSMMLSQPEQILTWIVNPQFILSLIPIILSVIAGILLYRSSVIRKMFKK